MKIAYIITRGDTIGGAQIHVKDMAYRLKDSGHDVYVLCGGSGQFTQQLDMHAIPKIEISRLKREICIFDDMLALYELIIQLKRLNPDIVACHSSKAGWLGRVAAALLGFPSVFTAHGWAFADGVSYPKKILYVLLEKFSAVFSDKIITVSDQDKVLAEKFKVAKADKIITVHNGISDIESSFIADPGKYPPTIVMTARMSEQKNHRELISAISRINERFSLLLIGDGPLEKELQNYADRLNVSDRVTFLGYQPNVAEWLRKSQIFVLSTNWEGFPLSILEAMRAGLPVIATDVGGISEAVIDGITGFLIPRGNEELLSRKISLLIVDPDLRSKMGTAGRMSYVENYTFEHMYDKTLAIYEDVLKNKKRRILEDAGRHVDKRLQ